MNSRDDLAQIPAGSAILRAIRILVALSEHERPP